MMISQRNRHVVLVVTFGGIALAILAGGPSSGADDSDAIEKIVNTWKERGEKAKTIVLELEFKKTVKAGEMVSPEVPEKVLEKDLTYSGERFVWLDGEKMRDLLVHIEWEPEQNAYVALNQTYLFNKDSEWILFEYPQKKHGFVHPSKKTCIEQFRTQPHFSSSIEASRIRLPSSIRASGKSPGPRSWTAASVR